MAGQLGDIELANRLADQHIAFCERVHEWREAELMRAELAGMYLQVGQFDKVIERGEAVLPAIKRFKHVQMESKLCVHLAEAHYETGNLETARRYAQRTLQIEEIGDLPYAAYTLGLIEKQEKQYDAAVWMFKWGIDIAGKTSDIFIEAYLQRELGQLHQLIEQQESAEHCLIQAVNLFTKMGLEDELKTTQAILDSTAS